MKKTLLWLLIASTLPACSWLNPFKGETKDEAAASASAAAGEGAAGVPKSPTEPGMVQIQRRAAGYTISMLLDASDENVYFVMDLPEDGTTEVDAAKDPKKIEQAKKAEATDPGSKESPQSLATRHVVNAQTFFFEKRYERALNEVSKSLELVPESPTAHSLKGSIHYKLGEKRLARESWEKALELDPQMDDVKLMLKKLN